jgi:hypothetical protein
MPVYLRNFYFRQMKEMKDKESAAQFNASQKTTANNPRFKR